MQRGSKRQVSEVEVCVEVEGSSSGVNFEGEQLL